MDEYKANLEEGAEYGKLAFDVFALEKWDYAAPPAVADDQQQWNSLVRQWLEMAPENRVQYYLQVQPRYQNPELPWTRPTASQIARVLAPHQSIQERNISVLMNGSGLYSQGPPVWLRTGYDPGLDGEMERRYRAMYRAASIDEAEAVLDDAALYDFESGNDGNGDGDGGDVWKKILFQLPQLINTDTVADDPSNESEYRKTNFDVEWFKQGEDEDSNDNDNDDNDISNPAFDAQIKLRNIIYVLDNEAIRKGIIKMKWLGESGDVVWENKLEPEEMGSGLIGALSSGLFLHELVDGGYFLDE